jgi:hypothetical protein
MSKKFFYVPVVFLLFFCVACASTKPICNSFGDNISSEDVGIQRGDTVMISYNSEEQKQKFKSYLESRGLVFVDEYENGKSRCLDMFNEYKRKDYTDLEKFNMTKEYNCFFRADYIISHSIMYTDGDFWLFYRISKEPLEIRNVSDFDYNRYGCGNTRDSFFVKKKIACPVGSRKQRHLCAPFATTTVIKETNKLVK